MNKTLKMIVETVIVASASLFLTSVILFILFSVIITFGLGPNPGLEPVGIAFQLLLLAPVIFIVIYKLMRKKLSLFSEGKKKS